MTVTVTDANGCSDTVEKTLTVHSNPTASISGDNSVCDGGSVTFTASGGTTYLWSQGGLTTPGITVTDNTTRIVTVTDANGCTDTAEKHWWYTQIQQPLYPVTIRFVREEV
ncbi:MAG: hypothetical protein IPK25_08850 [Saprospiraceae bacterium]|nr:hypothetical protein [Saprospiraceae bacterium]